MTVLRIGYALLLLTVLGLDAFCGSILSAAATALLVLTPLACVPLHLRAAKNNGVSRDEIKEVIMQSAIYCGIPAANATFHLAESVWDELGVESQQASR